MTLNMAGWHVYISISMDPPTILTARYLGGGHSRKRRLAALMAIIAASAGASFYSERFLFKQPYHTSILTGRMWLLELLNGNPHRIKDQLGMKKHVFKQLVWKLYLTTSANHTRYVDLEA